MIFKAISLSLAIAVGVTAIVPLATNTVEASAQQQVRKKRTVRFKKYSKQWWRAYRQRAGRRDSLNARRRSLRLRQIRLANARKMSEGTQPSANPAMGKTSYFNNTASAMLPSGEPAPRNWKSGVSNGEEAQYNVIGDNGMSLGSAAITVVGPAIGTDSDSLRSKTIGGVATNALRRTVIDRMVREDGWVVNDYQKEVGGKRVYVVVAQSNSAAGAVRSRLFYFTEADGRIYSLAINASGDSTGDSLEAESEKAILALQRRNKNTQQAELK